MIITIDGPAASGKSTVAKALAEKLGFYYLYTGMLYRAVAYILIREFGKTDHELTDLDEKDLGFINDLSYRYKDGKPHVFYKEHDITDKLFNSEFDEGSSLVSSRRAVREALIDIQRSVAKEYDLIADGRDCGSVVFPDADYKFFLTASLDVRAKRKVLDYNKPFEVVRRELAERDERDKSRDISPLVVPQDAVVIDNSELDKEQTLEKFASLIAF